jgi:hypothetical protein
MQRASATAGPATPAIRPETKSAALECSRHTPCAVAEVPRILNADSHGPAERNLCTGRSELRLRHTAYAYYFENTKRRTRKGASLSPCPPRARLHPARNTIPAKSTISDVSRLPVSLSLCDSVLKFSSSLANRIRRRMRRAAQSLLSRLGGLAFLGSRGITCHSRVGRKGDITDLSWASILVRAW